MKTYTQADVIEMLRKRCEEQTQSSLAREIGVSQPFLARVMTASALPGKKVLKALDLIPVRGYQRINSNGDTPQTRKTDR